jgi:hypothetical protein
MFYAPDAAERVAAMFRSFARNETAQLASEDQSHSQLAITGRCTH